jgi:hypothetical protein
MNLLRLFFGIAPEKPRAKSPQNDYRAASGSQGSDASAVKT